MTKTARSILAATMSALALTSLAACSSTSNSATSDAPAPVAADTSGSSPASDGTTAADERVEVVTDPCQLYSTSAMAAQMGADDVVAEAFDGVSPTCTYRSDAHYLEAELAVLDEEQLASTPRDPTAYLTDAAAVGVEVLDVTGIGDEVFGSSTHGGVTLVVRTGTTGYSLLLTNAGGGADAGNWVDEPAMVASAEQILTSVVS